MQQVGELGKNLAGFPFPFRPWILAANGCTGPNLCVRNALVAQEAIASAAPCQYCLSRRNERARTASFFSFRNVGGFSIFVFIVHVFFVSFGAFF